jgi:oligopeptide/dipeptide ABC transporter ATP-binding protein
VSWEIDRGETLVILGESGSGKSVTAQAIAGILPAPAKVTAGEVYFNGRSVLEDRRFQQSLRGKRIGVVFQNPLTGLNPGMTVGKQITEMFRVHSDLGKRAAMERAVELLALVQIPDPKDRVTRYPHELSGGMRQRVMIAIALSQEPELLIADEPTTALDATVQAQVIQMLQRIQEELGTAIVLITHDIGVASAMATNVVVMYAGRVVEQGDAYDVLRSPRHPYTQGLLSSVPTVELRSELRAIRGTPPKLYELAPGCAFAPRCDFATEACDAIVPPLESVGGLSLAACLRAEELASSSATGIGGPA